eukprot:scaffold51023_cov82-Phaeocystis_antarctica.AAC.1
MLCPPCQCSTAPRHCRSSFASACTFRSGARLINGGWRGCSGRLPGAKARKSDLPRSRSLNFSPRCRVVPFILTNAIIRPIEQEEQRARTTNKGQRTHTHAYDL